MERAAAGSPTPERTPTPRPTRTSTPTPTGTPTTQPSWFNATEVPWEATAAPIATRTTPLPFGAVDHLIATATGTAIAAQTAAPVATERAAHTATAVLAIAAQATSTAHATQVLAEQASHATATATVQDEERSAAAEQERAIQAIVARMRLPGPTDGESPSAPPGTVLPTPIPIRYAGIPTASREAGWVNATTLWLGVPHRSQFDDTLYAPTNCGPTSLGMILEAYGLTGYPTDAIRGEVNRISGDFNPDNGTSLVAIALVAQRAGLYPMDLFQRPGVFKRWTIDDVRAHLRAGRPIITLARYADLPGNSSLAGDINHYIVLSGLSGDQIIYNDSAYSQGRGRGLLISPEALQRAWANSNLPGHAVAFALNPGGDGLLSPMARQPAAEDGAENGADIALDDAALLELRGLARAAEFDDPAVLPGTIDLATMAAGPSGSLVLVAHTDHQQPPLSTAAVALLALLAYSVLTLGLVLMRLRHPQPG